MKIEDCRISCARVVVSGLVQGVCFRDFTQRTAARLGLAGWVRNLPDGRVEALAMGEKTDVELLIGALHEGPPGSRVSRLETTWCAPPEELAGFEVRY